MKNLNTVFEYLIQKFQTLNEGGRAIAEYKDPYTDAYAPSLDSILPEVTAPQLKLNNVAITLLNNVNLHHRSLYSRFFVTFV
jgi:hypothetical protein